MEKKHKKTIDLEAKKLGEELRRLRGKISKRSLWKKYGLQNKQISNIEKGKGYNRDRLFLLLDAINAELEVKKKIKNDKIK